MSLSIGSQGLVQGLPPDKLLLRADKNLSYAFRANQDYDKSHLTIFFF